jgi:transcription antitermination factor NusB
MDNRSNLKKEPSDKKRVGKRRKAREMVLNGLYYYELTGENLDILVEYINKSKNINKQTKAYARRLIEETMNNLSSIDNKLKEVIDNWEFKRIAIIDKSILRFATAEILFFPDIPVKVSIDEAVEIAKKFSTENSGGFVNGILDEIAKRENLLEGKK